MGSGLKCFPLEWTNQAFTFSEMHDLRYGIVQKKVVLTAQDYVIPVIWFSDAILSAFEFSRVVLVEFWHRSKPLY